MKRLYASAAAICLLALSTPHVFAAPASKAQRTPAGSFLRYRVYSVNDLLSQVSRDPVVRSRYARYYHIPPDQVAKFLQKQLKLTKLTRPERVTTYYVGDTGRLHAKAKTLPKGAAVFTRADGVPFLSGVCGNPIEVSRPLQTTAKNETPVSLKTLEPEKPETQSNVETKVLAAPAEIVSAPAETVTPAIISDAPVQVAQLDLGPSLLASIPSMDAVAPAISSGIEGIGYLSGVAGLIAGLVGTAGSDSRPTPPPPPPVPEPSCLTALSALLVGTGVYVRRKRAG